MARLGAEIGAAYPAGVHFVAVLKSSVVFLADLVRAVVPRPPVTVDFLALSPFRAGGERVRLVKDLDHPVDGRDVVVVFDIVDTGLTAAFILGQLQRRNPRSVAVCTLLDRGARRIVPIDLAFRGWEAPDEFFIGYGLDHEGRYRNVSAIAVADPAALADDPDTYVDQFHGRR